MKGRLKPGQFADFAVLNAPYLDVDDAGIGSIESDLTVVNGKAVYGAGEFAALAPSLEPIKPDWSPVNSFGGYQKA